MPFTPAHPAIVLPLNYLPKRFVSLSALIVGSMIPDFEYFLRMSLRSEYSHTIAGLFWFDVPLGFIILLLYIKLVRNNVIDNLPVFFNNRLSAYKEVKVFEGSFINIVTIALCLFIGSVSHIFWDSFTHESGYFVTRSHLSNTIDIAGSTILIFKILQHSSTIVGFIIIAYSIIQLPQGKITKRENILPYWVTVMMIAILVLVIRIATGLSISQYGSVIVSAISGILVGLLLSSVYPNKKKSIL